VPIQKTKETPKKKNPEGFNRPKVLICGNGFLRNRTIVGAEIVSVSNPTECLPWIQDPQMAVFIVVVGAPGGLQLQEALEILEKFEQETPKTARVLLADPLTPDIFKQAVNRAHIHLCEEVSTFERDLSGFFEKSLGIFHRATHRARLLRESTVQFRELEALNSSLEKIVLERTQHIEISKTDEDEKLNKVRQLIRLIKELGQTSSFEELLILLRKEFRKFHRTGEPILVYQVKSEHVEFVSLQSGQILFTHHKGPFPFASEIMLQNADLLKTLANHFGRPFVKTMYIPLEPRLMRQSSYQDARAGVCIEVSLNDVELVQFLDFVRERMQSIAITVDRLLLENALIQFSYRWEKTFDGFRDPISIVDLDFEVLRSNKKFSDKFARKKCFQTFAHKDEMCEGCPVPEAIRTAKPQKGQIQVGEQLFEVQSFPIVLENSKKVTNVVNQYVDITQSRDLYLRMVQSEKMGAIGLLAGNIAHELNNPLTGLRSLAQVLIQQIPNDASLQMDLQEIEKAAGRSQEIIRNLLEFSQGGVHRKKRVAMDDLVRKTMPMLKTVMRIHRQEIELDAKDSEIEVEPQLIQQVVFNLVSNACQAMQEPGVLSIRTYRNEDHSTVTLEVADTGPGIPKPIQDKIFEPFFTTKKEGLGTGLGLSFSKKIIENFGGRIKLISEEGKGTCFRVIFAEAAANEE
jgi:two-component system, NtrC family, sensor kinase